MREVKLEIVRYSDNGESTMGLMFIDNEYQCYTLEDEQRMIKVAGETRIPDGDYEVDFYNEVYTGEGQTTPLTKSYRNRYPFFDYHIHIKDVPNFKNVYIHIGNDDDDTDGCVLVGDGANNNKTGEGMISYSRIAYEKFYKKIWKYINTGCKVKLNVKSIYKTNKS